MEKEDSMDIKTMEMARSLKEELIVGVSKVIKEEVVGRRVIR